MFKVGDIIKGIESCNSRYTITTSKATLEVIEVIDNSTIKVRLIRHESPLYDRHVGKTFNLDSKLFVLSKIDNRRIENV